MSDRIQREITSDLERLHGDLKEIDDIYFKCSFCHDQLRVDDFICLPCTHRMCDDCWFCRFERKQCPVCSSVDIRAFRDDLGNTILRHIKRHTRCSTKQNPIIVSVESLNDHESNCLSCLNSIVCDMREEKRAHHSEVFLTTKYVRLAEDALDIGDIETARRNLKRARGDEYEEYDDEENEEEHHIIIIKDEED